MSYKILIIGNGFIGSNLFNYYSQLYPTQITNKDILNVRSPQSVKDFFKKNNNFTHIIYAAGLKDVKFCESDPDTAFEVNAEGVKRILNCLKSAKFIYISTDYVFDGSKGNYSELSVPNPHTTYGKSKLLGEWYTHIYGDNSMIVRTSGVYGNGCTWLKWLMSEMEKDSKIVCFSDVFNSPTYIDNLAQMILDMMDIDYSGIINLSGPEAINRFELYKTVFRCYNKNERNLSSGNSNGAIPSNISLDINLYQKLSAKKPASIDIGFSLLSSQAKLYEN